MNADEFLPKLPPRRRAHDVRELPERVLQSYSRLWQLETWLRHMVYLELGALMGDAWTTKVKIDKAERPQQADKRLIHMATPEEDPLSYVQLSELLRIIRENRQLFDPFLPPEEFWDARMEEIVQVRHRIAHIRTTNEYDLDRAVSKHADAMRSATEILRKRFTTTTTEGHTTEGYLKDGPVAVALFELGESVSAEMRERRVLRQRQAADLIERLTVATSGLGSQPQP